MRLATWNVNSIRSRLDRVLAFAERADIDVLALQETKCRTDQFPFGPFESAGYRVAVFGLDQWNGVAIASRLGLADVEESFPGQPAFGRTEAIVEARAIGATCAGVRVWSVYVPNGRSLDDPHYAYKLDFLEALRSVAAGWAASGSSVAIVGDWNVAPLDSDVWDASDPGIATHVASEVRSLFQGFTAIGFTDVTRRLMPEEHRYTFWDYQRLRFPRNEGMRIDHVLASSPLDDRTVEASIDREERKGQGASDHAPVVVTFQDDPGTVLS